MSRARPWALPRRSSHRGSVLAAGYWVRDTATRDPRAMVLELWENGAEVRRVPDGYVVLLRREQRVVAELGAAAPLVRHGGCSSSAPLSRRELEALPANALHLVSGGLSYTFALERLEVVDPASWLDVSAFTQPSVKSLGETARLPAALSAPADPQVLFDESVGRSAEDHARQAAVLQALRDGAQRPTESGSGSASAARFMGLALDLLRQLRRWFSRRGRPRADGSAPSNESNLVAPSAEGPGFWQRLSAAFATWLASTRLAGFIGRKHAEYLRDLFELLAQHDDEEVLRRAIPLGKGGAELGPPALQLPSPRTSLAISLGKSNVRSSVGLVTDLFQRLRDSYEAVFARLDAAGKHEQAAYFLAEILGEAERAVAYLERHGERLLAAQLAEARQLPAGLVVRQWFFAGERDRAVVLAVREGAFRDAILRLEASGQMVEASTLRLLQAERMAEGGLFVQAAELAHRVESGRAVALRWLELARTAGDLRGVPLELSLDESRFDAARGALEPLLEGHADDLPSLLHVAEQFAKLDIEVGKPLARELARELLAVAASTGMASVAAAASRVANYVGGAFKVDQPRLASFETRVGGSLRHYEYTPSDAGTGPAYDAHRLGSNLVIALGEAGVVVLNRRGQRLAHFDLPAHALVTSADGSRVLCVAPRGDRLEVGRIELATRRAQRWCEVDAKSFAREFDGESWFVCTSGRPQAPRDSELLQLDVVSHLPRVLRRLPMPLDGPTVHVHGSQVNLVGSEPLGSIERLRYQLPSVTLRQRQLLVELGHDGDEPPRVFLGAAAASIDDAPLVYTAWSADAARKLEFGDRAIELPSDGLEGSASLTLHRGFYALSVADESRTRILVGACAATKPHVDLVLRAAKQSALRFSDGLLLIADDAGRVIGIDPASGSPAYDLRI